MIFCTRCGTQNEDGARFCRNCAQPLARPSAQQQPPPPANPQRPPEAPYPGYQGAHNPGFQGQQAPYSNLPQSYASFPGAPSAQQGASGRAIASMVLTLIAFFVGCGPFLSIPALILGKQEMNAINAGQASRAGEMMAKIGFYGGIVTTVLYCGGGLLYALLMAFGIVGSIAFN